jgi:hypothetical protein
MVRIEKGALVDIKGNLAIGNGLKDGLVIVDNATLDGGYPTAGNQGGHGKLVITNGGFADISHLWIGRNGVATRTGTGTCEVVGSGSRIKSSQHFTVGVTDNAVGYCSVRDGGVISNTLFCQVAAAPTNPAPVTPLDGHGFLTVDGTNSLVTAGNGTTWGVYFGGTYTDVTGGVAHVTLTDGGTIRSMGPFRAYHLAEMTFELGDHFNAIHATGTATVDDGATIVLTFDEGFAPEKATYDLVTSDVSMTADESALVLDASALPEGYTAVLMTTATALQVEVSPPPRGTVVIIQ